MCGGVCTPTPTRLSQPPSSITNTKRTQGIPQGPGAWVVDCRHGPETAKALCMRGPLKHQRARAHGARRPKGCLCAEVRTRTVCRPHGQCARRDVLSCRECACRRGPPPPLSSYTPVPQWDGRQVAVPLGGGEDLFEVPGGGGGGAPGAQGGPGIGLGSTAKAPLERAMDISLVGSPSMTQDHTDGVQPDEMVDPPGQGSTRRGGKGRGRGGLGAKGLCTKNGPTRVYRWYISGCPTMVTWVCGRGRGVQGGEPPPPPHSDGVRPF